MGDSTTFDGWITMDPPLSEEEMKYLHKFSTTRRMIRRNGPYFVEGSGFLGQGDDPDVISHNDPPPGQPGLWCPWIPHPGGKALIWDQGEKSSDAQWWMLYLIQHFLRPGALAYGWGDGRNFVPGIRGGHWLNGTINAQGDDPTDRWDLIVKANEVFVSEIGGPQDLQMTPNDYIFPLTSPQLRDYFRDTFKVAPNPEWTQGIVYVDPATGAMTNRLYVFIFNERAAEFTIDESGRAKRAGVLEWEPGEE
jgi:hypothetical protein